MPPEHQILDDDLVRRVAELSEGVESIRGHL